MPKEAGVPGSGGITRPTLHAILSRPTIEEGAAVRLGVSVETLAQDTSGVDVRFSDGTRERYDFVIGADGIHSRTREQIFPGAPRPEYTGQCTWRVFTKRPPGVDRRHYFLGGPNKVGFTPVSDEQMYLFVNERTVRKVLEPDELRIGLAKLLEGYGGHIATIRDSLMPTSEVVLRPLEAFVLPAPWNVNRVLLIGDAAHPTTPQLSSGAGMAVEDAIVLAEELVAAGTVTAAFAAFMARREARCRLVVDSSVAIGKLEQAHAPGDQLTAIVDRTLKALSEPI